MTKLSEMECIDLKIYTTDKNLANFLKNICSEKQHLEVLKDHMIYNDYNSFQTVEIEFTIVLNSMRD